MTALVHMLQLFLQRADDEQHHLALSIENEYLKHFSSIDSAAIKPDSVPLGKSICVLSPVNNHFRTKTETC